MSTCLSVSYKTIVQIRKQKKEGTIKNGQSRDTGRHKTQDKDYPETPQTQDTGQRQSRDTGRHKTQDKDNPETLADTRHRTKTIIFVFFTLNNESNQLYLNFEPDK